MRPVPRRRRRGRRLTAAALAACAVLAVQAGAARADILDVTIDEAVSNLGTNKGLHLIDPGVPDPAGELLATWDPGTNAFTAPIAGLDIPPKTIEDVPTGGFPPLIDLIVEIEAVGDPNSLTAIMGTFDETTGDLEATTLNAAAIVNAYPQNEAGNDDLLLGRCRISPVDMSVSTGNADLVDDSPPDPDPDIVYPAEPFDPEGGATEFWADLPAPVAAGGLVPSQVCPAVDTLTSGPGGIFVGGSAATSAGTPDSDGDGVPDPADNCPSAAGPASNNGCPVPPPPPAARPAELSITVKPRKRTVNVGRAARYRARVTNTGGSAASGVRVCVRKPKSLKGKRCKSIGSLAAGASATRAFRLKPKRAAAGRRFKLRFRATARGVAAKRATAFLKVRR